MSGEKRCEKKTLYDKITGPIRLIWIAGILILLAALEIFIRVIILPAIHELSLDMLNSKSASISYFLDSQAEQLGQVGDMLNPRESLEKSMEKLKFLDQVEHSYESLGIVDTNGVVHVTSDIQFSIREREYYRKIQDEGTDTVFSEPVTSLENGKMIVLILCRMGAEDSNEKEYMSGAISTDYIQEVLERSNTFGFCTQVVRDTDGEAVMSTGRKTERDAHVYTSPISAWPGWSLRLEIPQDFLYRQLWILNGVFALTSAIVFLMINRLMKQITAKTIEPIRNLSELMNGNHLRSLKLVEEGADTVETAQLTDSYNRMVENTEELLKELEHNEIQKKDAEYRALIQQIKPHFLYNTLEMIQSMCLDYEDDRVENTIGLLADFFRSSLSGDRVLIPLREELHQVEDYMKLQLLRYQGQFDYEISDETEGGVWFLRFTLQPVVENAIYHGVKHSDRKEHIRIQCQKSGELIHVTVENTCENCDSGKIQKLNELFASEADGTQYPGYGLYNVNCRLKLHFGENCHLYMEENGGRVRVTVIHPVVGEREAYECFNCR